MTAPRLTLVTSQAPAENPSHIPEQLRSIARDVEMGQLVGASSACVIVKGGAQGLMIYGIEAGEPVARLNAAYMLLNLALRELEAIAKTT